MKHLPFLILVLSLSPAQAAVMIRVEVALCDVETQGVVAPSNLKQCRSSRPDSNLYWGALYGVKTFLPKAFQAGRRDMPLSAEEKTRGGVERFALNFVVENKNVTVVATAWTDMKEALSSTLHPQEAELVIFVGHNGLMDFRSDSLDLQDDFTPTHVAVLACHSESYFKPLLRRLGHQPYVLTRSLMAPEAYVVEAIIRSFLEKASSIEAARAAGNAYSKYQSVSSHVGRGVFWPNAPTSMSHPHQGVTP